MRCYNVELSLEKCISHQELCNTLRYMSENKCRLLRDIELSHTHHEQIKCNCMLVATVIFISVSRGLLKNIFRSQDIAIHFISLFCYTFKLSLSFTLLTLLHYTQISVYNLKCSVIYIMFGIFYYTSAVYIISNIFQFIVCVICCFLYLFIQLFLFFF